MGHFDGLTLADVWLASFKRVASTDVAYSCIVEKLAHEYRVPQRALSRSSEKC